MIRQSLLGASLAVTLSANDGAALFDAQCNACHVKYVPVNELMENFMKGKNEKLKLLAPTLNQLNFRIKQMVGDPKGDAEMHRIEVVEFIKDYVIHPDKAKSVCLAEVIDNFETMPSMKGQISESELEAVAEFIYDYTQPEERK
ncbi:MAG: c-type cytochrome [Epsilonproteobacteria bacterium]|nr:c-type cytochrome [Campylobacterota bacterium]